LFKLVHTPISNTDTVLDCLFMAPNNLLAHGSVMLSTAGCTHRCKCDEWAALGPKLAQMKITTGDSESKLPLLSIPKNQAKFGTQNLNTS